MGLRRCRLGCARSDRQVTDTLHIRPVPDAEQHTISDDCWCGPTFGPVEQNDGTIRWIYVHHREVQR
jgi:hypothetical protein